MKKSSFSVAKLLIGLACLLLITLVTAQTLPPFPGFGSTKQPMAQGTGEEKIDPDDVAAKRAWLFLEYPQLSLVPEPPARGSFHSLQKVQPPLPFLPIPGLPIYSWAEGYYFYDDLEVNYSPMRSSANRQRTGGFMKMSVPEFPGGGGGGTNETAGGYSAPPAYSYTNSTDLWIEIVPNLATNGTATDFTLKVHNTLTDIYYDVMASTNLSVTNGWFVLGGVLATNGVSVLPAPVWPTNNPIQFFVARASGLDTDGDGLPDWWELKNALDPFSADSGNTGTMDGYKNPAGDGWSNLEKYRNGRNPNTFYTPAAPANFRLIVQTNGFVQLFWDRALGNVTGYVIEVDTGSGFTTLATLGSSTNNFLDTSAPVSATYRVKATNVGGNSHYSPELKNLVDPRMTVDAKIVRGPGGRLFLAVAALPPDAVSLLVYRQTFDADFPQGDYYQSGGSVFDAGLADGSFTVALSSLTNGVALLPTNSIPAYGRYFLYVTAKGPDGRPGHWTPINEPPTVPFLDGTAAMKQNLSFLLRSAGAFDPLHFRVKYADESYSYLYAWPADYVYSGCFDLWGYAIQNEFEPFEENRYFRNFAFPVNGVLSSGLLDSGITDYVATEIRIGLNPAHSFPTYSYAVNSNQTAIGSTLSRTDSRWIFGGYQTFGFHIDYGLYIDASNNLALAADYPNIYGLPIQSAKLKQFSGAFTTLNAGSAIAPTVYGLVYHEVTEPVLETTGFYFARPGVDAIPGSYDFAVTNATPLLITGVGQPFTVAGWARQRIVNGFTNKFAYLGQYFDKAYTITNGVKTTNQTGILSEYGNFLPTEPGRMILTTKADLDQTTNQVGECLVHVIGLNVDANHDGILDRTFTGLDQTSPQRPFRFWVNNDHDAGEDIKDSAPDYQDGLITTPRDLEDFARLWITGIPTNQDLTIQISWRNEAGQPAIKLYRAVEDDGGIGYLTNTTVAGTQINYGNISGTYVGYGASLGLIAPGQTLSLASTNFLTFARKHFLFEGAGIGSGELVLSIIQNSVVIGESSLFFDLHDVKDFYERYTATNVTRNLPPSALVSQFRPDHLMDTPPNEAKQLAIFVHGINNTEFEYESSSETIFKRLYWSGYKGRLAAFRWPCTYFPGNEGTIIPFHKFDRGEFYAYKSANAFKEYLRFQTNRFGLMDYTINILAHSMGNGVVGEAIVNGAPFDNYILSQGAVPAHAYDFAAPTLQRLVDAETNKPTPYFEYDGGYHRCFTNIGGHVVNFYNTNDFALASGTYQVPGIGTIEVNWVRHNENEKPESFLGSPFFGYEYGYFPGSYTSYRQESSVPITLTDVHEIRSMVSRSRTAAVGAQGGLAGVIDSSIDLKSSFEFDSTRPEHGAQFSRPIQSSREYYIQVLNSFQILP